MARNSAFSIIHRHDALKNASTRNSAACTVERAVITPNDEASSTAEKM